MTIFETKPIVVSGSTARRLIDVGSTKFWELVRSGKIQTVEVGGVRMVIFASLERLATGEDQHVRQGPR